MSCALNISRFWVRVWEAKIMRNQFIHEISNDRPLYEKQNLFWLDSLLNEGKMFQSASPSFGISDFK